MAIEASTSSYISTDPVQHSALTVRRDLQAQQPQLNALNIEQAKTVTQDVLDLIHQRFEFNNSQRLQFLLTTSNMPANSWDIIKYKIATKALIGKLHFLAPCIHNLIKVDE